ncbi:hypothetical protein [Kineococcus radiotolerans]|uniref:Uncharacterized protein n=1 Tax=Kineococcus radiotolerans (strain ATCC BAA-149 / DSM 14245 / SRS30216) TaxID=266940 RepID=A6W8T6_KINRD|nr:hypothetical protein [Kineococcus radiotolerans]ABS03225.1 hypothetical protein Krad_1739 [Kineococcus radiotolerans SRS30216 = ATCC BAA-149]
MPDEQMPTREPALIEVMVGACADAARAGRPATFGDLARAVATWVDENTVTKQALTRLARQWDSDTTRQRAGLGHTYAAELRALTRLDGGEWEIAP